MSTYLHLGTFFDVAASFLFLGWFFDGEEEDFEEGSPNGGPSHD